MMNYKKTKEVSVPEQNIEVDPRSKEKVKGTKRMLADKKKTATWY